MVARQEVEARFSTKDDDGTASVFNPGFVNGKT
jgi:hypothetical protein